VVKVIVKPIEQLVDVDKVEQEARQKTEEFVKTAPKNGQLYLLSPPSFGAYPSLLASNCPVKAVYKMFFGDYGRKEDANRVIFGELIHRRYQESFKAINPKVTVLSEVELDGRQGGGVKGVADIVYIYDDYDGQEKAGVIELKSRRYFKSPYLPDDPVEVQFGSHKLTWYGYVKRVYLQLASYVKLLKDSGETVDEAYVVTRAEVTPVSLSELDKHAETAMKTLEALNKIYEENRNNPLSIFPSRAPYPNLCSNCQLRDICPTFRQHAKELGIMKYL